MSTERWLPVPGWEGFYEVSSLGRARSLDRVLVRSNGAKYTHRGGPKKLSGKKYPVLVCRAPGRKVQGFNMHRLMAELFLGPGEGHVRHLNDDPWDLRLENLAWGTRSDNMLDSVRNGTHAKASRTRCRNDHEYTDENTAWWPQKSGRLYRVCKACRRANRERRGD